MATPSSVKCDEENTNSEQNVSPKTFPADISYDSMIVNLSFHPSKDVLAAGDMEGDIHLHSYSVEESNRELLTLNSHKKAVRGVQFSRDGEQLFSVSKDKSVVVTDMNEGRVKHKIKGAHEKAIYSMIAIDNFLIATGDDDGRVKMWDCRTARSVMDIKEMEDYISCMTVNSERRVLLVTSGEGTLSAFNIRGRKLDVQSELSDSELMSVAVVKDGRKVVVGTGNGEVDIYNWGEWGLMSDRFVGHPDAVGCIVPITADIICTGCNDGKVRAVSILPNRFVGVVGSHGEFPIESMDLSRDGMLLASCSHEQIVKFWNVSDLYDCSVDARAPAEREVCNKPLTTSRVRDDFFDELGE